MIRIITLSLLLISTSSFASGWECINRNSRIIPTCDTWRWEVPRGWLVSIDINNYGASITYFPDESHEWKI
jgi:hypothetical protein